jgi:ATP-dependent Lon protease
MAHRSALDPTATPDSNTHTRFDFLPNAKSEIDADHFGLDKVKRRLTEYLAVVHPRALIGQEAEVEQAKAQGVVLKDAIEDQRDKGCIK